MALCICGILWNIKVMMTVSLRTCRLYVWIHRKNELEAYFWRQICLMKEFVLTILCRTNIIKMVFYFTVNRTQVFWNLRNCKGYSCTYPPPPPLSISKGNTRVTDSKTCRPPPNPFFLTTMLNNTLSIPRQINCLQVHIDRIRHGLLFMQGRFYFVKLINIIF